jgi:hypothetical protein
LLSQNAAEDDSCILYILLSVNLPSPKGEP